MPERSFFEEAARRAGRELVDVQPMAGGASATVFALQVRPGSGPHSDPDSGPDSGAITTVGGGDAPVRMVVLRQNRFETFKGHVKAVAEKEFEVLSVLHRAGFAVPEPYAVDADAGWLVMDYVPGSTRSELDAASIDAMADFLRDLHRIDPATVGLGHLDAVEDPVATLPIYLADAEVVSAVATQPAMQLLAAGTIRYSPPAKPSLLHGDYWPGNAMFDGPTLAGVIDWEDTCLGDPLADLATARVELLTGFGEAAMRRFTTRYLSDPTGTHEGEPDPLALALWEAFVSASALSTMHHWGLDPEEEERRRITTARFLSDALATMVSVG